MGIAALIFLLAVSAFACAAVGLFRMPLHCRSFSTMTSAEKHRFAQGLTLLCAPLVLILVLVLALL